MLSRLKEFLTFRDSQFEDVSRGNLNTVVYRDFSAGLVTAMTAIPMAIGFAMAMGLRPEQGLIAGTMARLVGAHVWRLQVSGVRPDGRLHSAHLRGDAEV